jgi:uncharacterized protein YndB with AHSA1/START domain
VPTVAAKRTIGAAPAPVWDVVGDPHHLPRWWPRVLRVEGVEERAFTEVLTGKRGKLVRADFDVLEANAGRRVVWAQHVGGTPFEGVLRSAVTAIDIFPAAGGAATDVRIELRQELAGGMGGRASWRMLSVGPFGAPLVKRAAAGTLEQALDGLQRVFGDGG